MVDMGDQYATRWEPAGAAGDSRERFDDAETVAGDVFARTCVEAMAGRRRAERELRSRILLSCVQDGVVVVGRVYEHDEYLPNLQLGVTNERWWS